MADKTKTRRSRPPTAQRNIESILKLERADEQKLSALQRFSLSVGWFVGTLYFVFSQLVMVMLWVALNAWLLPPPLRFDPFPFQFLSTTLALEAVMLTSFVLIRQNAMDVRTERRNHLELQINLLAEKEATGTLNALRAIAKRLKVQLPPDVLELSQDTPIERIARDLRSRERTKR